MREIDSTRDELILQRLDEIHRQLGRLSDGWLEYLVIRASGRSILIRTSAIDWIEAKGNYVNVHRGKESSLVRKSMRALETQLDPKAFIRVHRSTIVNIGRIRELQRMFKGEFRILLDGGKHLTLSRSYRRKLQELVGGTL